MGGRALGGAYHLSLIMESERSDIGELQVVPLLRDLLLAVVQRCVPIITAPFDKRLVVLPIVVAGKLRLLTLHLVVCLALILV